MKTPKLGYTNPVSTGRVFGQLKSAGQLNKVIGGAQALRLKVDDALGKMRSAGRK